MTRKSSKDYLRYPLRAVVAEVMEQIAPGVEVKREKLECGHVVRIRHDHIGDTNAYRRRCKKCPPKDST